MSREDLLNFRDNFDGIPIIKAISNHALKFKLQDFLTEWSNHSFVAWQDWHCPYMVTHGLPHIQDVFVFFNRAYLDSQEKIKRLKEAEIFCLVLSIWLHDIGLSKSLFCPDRGELKMKLNPFLRRHDEELKPLEKVEEIDCLWVRENHALLTKYLLTERRDLLPIIGDFPEDVREIIADICLYHSGKTLLESGREEEGRAYYKKVKPLSEIKRRDFEFLGVKSEVNVLLLAALLRLLDGCDQTRYRIISSEMIDARERQNMFEQERIYEGVERGLKEKGDDDLVKEWEKLYKEQYEARKEEIGEFLKKIEDKKDSQADEIVREVKRFQNINEQIEGHFRYKRSVKDVEFKEGKIILIPSNPSAPDYESIEKVKQDIIKELRDCERIICGPPLELPYNEGSIAIGDEKWLREGEEEKDISVLKKKCEDLVAKEKPGVAEKLYQEKIFPLVKEIVKEKAEMDGLVGKYDGLILTVGGRPEPLILTITALNPKKKFFIYSSQTEEHLDSIAGECGILASEVKGAEVERADASDVYKEAKKKIEEWKGENIAIDITGGTKPMAGGGAIAGGFLNADLLYVKSEPWKNGPRYPIPGSEQIIRLANPFDIFGDLDEKKAIELFNGHNYGISARFFDEIKDKTGDQVRHVKFRIEEDLAGGYGAWDIFDFTKAKTKLERALADAKKFGEEYDEGIETHIKILTILSENATKSIFELLQDDTFSSHLMVDVFCNARRRIEQDRYDDAIIRFYRVLELIAQYRLAKRGINTSDVKISDAEVTKEFEKYSEELYGARRGIADRIGLMDSWLLLYVLKEERIKNFSELKKIKDKIGIRNELLIEHQNQLGNKKKCDVLEKFVRGWLKKIVDGLDKMCEEYGFIRLD